MTSNFGMVQLNYEKLPALNRWRKRRIRRIVRKQRWEKRMKALRDRLFDFQ